MQNHISDAEQEALDAKQKADVAKRDGSEAVAEAKAAEDFAVDAIQKAESAAQDVQRASESGKEENKASLSQARLAITEATDAIHIAESARGKAESARNKAEQARIAAEEARNKAENARLSSEEARTKAEAVRGDEELARLHAEEVKRKAEDARSEAEGALKQAEAAIKECRQAQQAAEGARDEAELALQELHTQQRELHEYATSLEIINRDLEQFASVASHDLQAPLRKIKTFSEQVEAEAQNKLSSESLDGLKRIRKSVQSMQNLITDLLALARVTQHKPFAPVDLANVVDEVITNLEAAITQKKAVIEVGAMETVMGDDTQLLQLIQNLVENGLKFQPKDNIPRIKIASTCDSDDMCQITVEDNGIGFDEKESKRIFESFERLHGVSVYPGTGIGLAICKRIAERHGGEILVSSAPGTGTVFTIRLPMAKVAII